MLAYLHPTDATVYEPYDALFDYFECSHSLPVPNILTMLKMHHAVCAYHHPSYQPEEAAGTCSHYGIIMQ
jgi:hypothetical protein